MASRNWAEVAPNANTIALNAYIFGYGGHSLVTPHTALKRLWWTDERINAKVDRTYITSKLRGEELDFLDRTVGFGSDDANEQPITGPSNSKLSDEDETSNPTSLTYMDWIMTRAKRFFLILAEIGVPDQIFGCIDDSWTDHDLPLTLEDIARLELTADANESVDRKFHDMQFVYLLRELKAGEHIDYNPRELIPLEHVDKVPPAVTVQEYGGRVHFPAKPDDVFMRRKVTFPTKDAGSGDADMFRQDVVKAQSLPHRHIAPAWASYTCGNAGFLLSDFVAEHTLRTYIDHRTPSSLLRVPPVKRPQLLVEWMLCLTEALAYLHEHGEAHTRICPSNIWIDKDNHIAFADLGCLRTFQKAKRTSNAELYEYAAPESPICEVHSITTGPGASPPSFVSTFARRRKRGETDSTSSPSSNASVARTSRSHSVNTSNGSRNASLASSGPCDLEYATIDIVTPSWANSPQVARSNNHASASSSQLSPSTSYRHDLSLPDFTAISNDQARPGTATGTCHTPHSTASAFIPSPAKHMARDILSHSPDMSDVFSLGCIFLDILTFLLKGKTTDFVKFRLYGATTNSFGSRHQRREDSSFHSDPSIIWDWIEHLEQVCLEKEDSEQQREKKKKPRVRKQSGDLHSSSSSASHLSTEAFVALLRLTRVMLCQNAHLRPTASAIRRRLREIQTDMCSFTERMCHTCAEAEVVPLPSRPAPLRPIEALVRVEDIADGAATSDTASVPLELEATLDARKLDDMIRNLNHQAWMQGLTGGPEIDSSSPWTQHATPVVEFTTGGEEIVDDCSSAVKSSCLELDCLNAAGKASSSKPITTDRTAIAAEQRAVVMRAAALRIKKKESNVLKSFLTRSVPVQ